jgi:hypothetical protein
MACKHTHRSQADEHEEYDGRRYVRVPFHMTLDINIAIGA